jgi:hypothetical protein
LKPQSAKRIYKKVATSNNGEHCMLDKKLQCVNRELTVLFGSSTLGPVSVLLDSFL